MFLDRKMDKIKIPAMQVRDSATSVFGLPEIHLPSSAHLSQSAKRDQKERGFQRVEENWYPCECCLSDRGLYLGFSLIEKQYQGDC